jgi:hypothetical protein
VVAVRCGGCEGYVNSVVTRCGRQSMNAICCEAHNLTERRCCSKHCSPVCLCASAYNVMLLQSNSTRGIRLGALFASQGRQVLTATLCVAL